jgi:glycosyltransferase involved in cell wall biosynthesis
MIYIVVPAHNEAKFLVDFLESVVNQTLLPNRLILVDDNSSDETYEIASKFAEQYSWISVLQNKSVSEHEPGSKVIQAFNKGFESLPKDFEIILKLDADLLLPSNYIQEIHFHFKNNPKTGIAGGFAYILKNNQWVLENLTDKDHVRGALKAYRKTCFEDIGGLKPAMGWDTLDELLAKFYGYEVRTLPDLKVKHLKPTGFAYHHSSKGKQGLVFYQLGYGFWLTFIATLKLNIKKKRYKLIYHDLLAFFKAVINSKAKLVNLNQQKFIQNYRWNQIKNKLKLR